MGRADLISDLGDDVVVHILELLPDAGDAVRTGALSRRWRGLWTRIPVIRFASSSRPEFSGDTGAERFASCVNYAVALRAAETGPAIQHLAMSFVTRPPREPVPRAVVEAAQRCIRVAVQHDVKSLALELHRSTDDDSHGDPCDDDLLAPPVAILDGLPRSAKMETMRLALGRAKVTLFAATGTAPAPAFASLVDLTLEGMDLGEGSGHHLMRLLSSACCPRLQKLRLRDLAFPFNYFSREPEEEELLLEAEALLELSWRDIRFPIAPLSLRTPLRLRTPRLRVLRMADFELNSLAISAPKLEELLFFSDSGSGQRQEYSGQPDRITDIDGGLPCVRSLRVEMPSHNSDEPVSDAIYSEPAFRLLHCCTAVACLGVRIFVYKDEDRPAPVLDGRIPRLPQVTSLTVHFRLCFELHSFGSGMAADILAQCSTNLKYLRICCSFCAVKDFKPNFFCNHRDSWESQVVYCLSHLKEVEFVGLAATECELWFMQSIMRASNTKQLRKVSVSFEPRSSLDNRMHAFERITQLQGHGVWTCCQEPYLSLEWKPAH